MSRTSFLILLGVVTILTPFSGFPIAVRSLTTIVLGVCVLAVGLSLRANEMRAAKKSHTPEEPAHEEKPSAPEIDVSVELEAPLAAEKEASAPEAAQPSAQG